MGENSKQSDDGYAKALRRIERCRGLGDTRLYSRGLGLSTLPPEIGQLTALSVLDLSKNQLSTLPPEIGQLTALTHLSLSGNQFSTLPPEIRQLTALTRLVLRRNQLSTLPPEIGQLTALTTLNLEENELSTLPPEIGQLTALTWLDLRGNQLSTLPPEIRQLTALEYLDLRGNPGLGIPDSILAGPLRPQDILNFYFEQQQAAAAGTSRAIGEVKMMLVGRGGAGKTSLRRYFLGQPHDVDEPETPGIALNSFELDCGKGSITVRMWDFAGQEITHALHRFFLTEGCIYVLTLDPRSNTEMQDAEYWLGLLARYAGDAPVLLALNRQDARQGGYDVDRVLLQEQFPAVRNFTRTNCANRDGCDELRQRLVEAIETLDRNEPPHLEVPGKWRQVMEDCGADGIGDEAPASPQHITLDEFREICATHGEPDSEKQESLARLLHKLGVVLHFVDEPRLRDTAVLDPHWVTDGVYRLLRCKDTPGSDGVLSLNDAMEALPGEDEADARFLLRLMERFEMCFALEDGAGVSRRGRKKKSPRPEEAATTHWLVPGALDPFQPVDLGGDWQQADGVRMRYVYDPLPEGVLPRFIVRTQVLSEGLARWRHGVVLEDGRAKALVRRGTNRNHVEITATGPDDERLRLLEIIQGNLERIHADLPDPRPIAELELADLPTGRRGVYRRIEELKVAEGHKVAVPVDDDRGGQLIEPTRQLDRTSEPAARSDERVPLEVFVSYSHKDMRRKMVFQNNLTVMQQKKFISPWHDGLIEPGTLWLEEIKDKLARMDVFVGLLTTAFLASDFIQKVELAEARARLAEDEPDLLFVLIVVDDIPLDGLDLSAYQLLKPGGKAISKYSSLREGFDQAQAELEAIVRQRRPKRRDPLDDERGFGE